MPPKRTSTRSAHPQAQSHAQSHLHRAHPLQPPYASDAEPSDFHTTTTTLPKAAPAPPPPPTRSNAELNLSVLRRHDPRITAILSIAPYAVVYLFSPPTQQWEKCGIEGTLFVCQLAADSAVAYDRYAVVILNRRGMDNFETELLSVEDVEVTDEYVILQVAAESEGEGEGRGTEAEGKGGVKVYGLWIFSEPAPSSTALMREVNARIIQDCAALAQNSRALVREQQRLQGTGQGGQAGGQGQEREQEVSQAEPDASIPMGRQLSLRELFGQQREQDSGWSAHTHTSPPTRHLQPASARSSAYPLHIAPLEASTQAQPQPSQPPPVRAQQPALAAPQAQRQLFAPSADTAFFTSTQRHAPPPAQQALPAQPQQAQTQAQQAGQESGGAGGGGGTQQVVLEDLFRSARMGRPG
ncbi:hypothetical protein LTR16_002185 [Cryomyces antarcticus]|uniref:PH domain-like protein n=1 Tax=Cryomyces antarcticus TaxID=329879 RepID=A0ABR0M7N8_9PEZI|nr:hypothetical protein LTR16_002185 [Cryomyces antarcticus]